jgi:hypothetical protein
MNTLKMTVHFAFLSGSFFTDWSALYRELLGGLYLLFACVCKWMAHHKRQSLLHRTSSCWPSRRRFRPWLHNEPQWKWRVSWILLLLKVLIQGCPGAGIAKSVYRWTKGPEGRGSFPSSGSRFFSFPQRPGRLWGPPSLLSNGQQGLFLRGHNRLDVKLTDYVHLVPRWSMVELYLHSPMRLLDVVLT